MRQTKFTPGPWQVAFRGSLQVCDCDGEVRGCAPIANIVQSHGPKPSAEDRANAHLIAAAPELYEACDDGNDDQLLLVAANAVRAYGNLILADRLEKKHERETAALKKARGEA